MNTHSANYYNLDEHLLDANPSEKLIEEVKCLRKEIKELRELFELKDNCRVCKIRGKAQLCSNCNFKVCNSCFTECLVCHEKTCFNCSNIPSYLCIAKNCAKSICDACLPKVKIEYLENNFKKCFSCNNKVCSQPHSFECFNCGKIFCTNCIILCQKCGGFCCKNCEFDSHLYDSVYCIHMTNKSLLIGTENGVIKFDHLNMKIENEFEIGKEKCCVLDILKIKNKIITAMNLEGKVKIWNNQNFDSLNFEFEAYGVNETRQIREDLIGLVCYSPSKPYKCFLFDLHNNKIVYEKFFKDTFGTTLTVVNSDTFLIGLYTGIARFSDIRGNICTDGFEAHKGMINSFIKSKFEKDKFISSGIDGMIKVWKFDKGLQKLNEIKDKRFSNANVINFDWNKIKELNDRRIVYCDSEYKIKIVDLNTFNYQSTKSHSADVYDFLQLNDNVFLSCSKDKTIKKWDLRKLDFPVDSVTYTHPVLRFQTFNTL